MFIFRSLVQVLGIIGCVHNLFLFGVIVYIINSAIWFVFIDLSACLPYMTIPLKSFLLFTLFLFSLPLVSLGPDIMKIMLSKKVVLLLISCVRFLRKSSHRGHVLLVNQA